VLKISRRQLLTGSFAGFAVLVAAPYAVYQLRYGKPTRIVIAILRRRLGYLQLETGSMQRFAEQYVVYKGEHAAQLARLSIVALPMTYVTLYRFLPMGHPLRRLEDNVVSNFLLSTDFFLHGGDESREVKYLSFYDPLAAPCRNPFVHLRKSA
jgi:hypothetical protein